MASLHRTLMVAALLSAALGQAASAQPGRATGQGGRYDPSTESRLSGQVSAVENVMPPDRAGRPTRYSLFESDEGRPSPGGLIALLMGASPSFAQGRGGGARRLPPTPPVIHRTVPVPTVRGQVVFIGGYYYDPFFGPYPWWPRTAYPYWYFPVYATRAEVRIQLEPEAAEDAAVYVDGFYAGIVDDFDGVFQALPLPPGGHEIAIYLEGYRTLKWNAYLRPGTTLKLRETLERLPAGEPSEPPAVAPPVPAPPAGTYAPPVTPSRTQLPTKVATPQAVGFGTLVLRMKPTTAAVTIDDESWVSSDDGQFTIQVPVGKHHVEVFAPGRERFSVDAVVREGEITSFDVLLSDTRR